MAVFRRLKGLAVLFILVVIISAGAVILTSEPATASRCNCWVMYCTVEEPIFCWDVCVPCPPFP